MDMGQRIRRLREQAGLTQAELADLIGISRPAIGQWENGRAKPRLDKLNDIADYFHVTVTELLGEEGITPTAANAIGASRPVPLLGYSHMGDTVDEETCERVVQVPEDVVAAHPKAYCVHADGCCMDNRYPDDSVLLIDPTMQPFNGCAVLAETEDYQSVVRVYSKGSSTLMLSPDSHSGEYEDIIVRADDAPVKLKGVVVWYQAEKDVREA